MDQSQRKKPHALLIPYPLQGHIIPFAHLATKLASNGFTVTFVNTESIHHQTSKAHNNNNNNNMFAGVRNYGLDINYEVISDGLPIAFDRSLNHDQFMASLLHVISAHVEELVKKMMSSDNPVTCIIADTFFVWPSTISKKFGIPYISFWTETALVFSLYYHMHLLRLNGHFGCCDNREDAITYIPGVPEIEPTDLMSYLQETDTSSVVHQIIFKAFEEAKGADYVICNTVQELEPETILALNAYKPFYAIGPIFPPSSYTIATSLWTESNCKQWLDTKPKGSVLYISFGSYAHLSKKDLEEIACGVLNSEVGFIWVLRPDIVSSDEVEPLPKGFMEESKERGMVVPWCCQTEVLAHDSVGGFLTHCGWNSVLESIWSSVPMLCFPLLTDQFTNRKLVVNDWKVGLDLGRKGKADRREVISKKIKCLMGREEFKKKIKEVRRALEHAISANPRGSSVKNFESFIADLLMHDVSKNVK